MNSNYRSHKNYQLLMLLILMLFYVSDSFANEQLSEQATQKSEQDKILHVGIALRPVFQFAVEENKYSGLDVELGTAIAKEAGYELEMYDYPWSRIIYSIETGRIDLTFSAAKTTERRAFALFTDEYLRHGYNKFYIHKNSAKRFASVGQLEDLQQEPFIVGVQRGYKYGPDYEELLNATWFTERLQTFNNSTSKIESLLLGRTDGFIGSEYGTNFILNRMDVSSEIIPLFNLKPYNPGATTFMMFSKKTVSQQIVDDFDAAIRRLNASGKLLEIKKKYSHPL